MTGSACTECSTKNEPALFSTVHCQYQAFTSRLIGTRTTWRPGCNPDTVYRPASTPSPWTVSVSGPDASIPK